MQIPRCARDDNWKAKAPAGGQRYELQNPDPEQEQKSRRDALRSSGQAGGTE